MLLALSALLFGAISPIIRRTTWFGQKQDNLRGFLIARERLSNKLRPAIFLEDLPESGADYHMLLRFHQPEQVQTAEFGKIGAVSPNETVPIDLTATHELRLYADGVLALWDPITDTRFPYWRSGEGTTASVTRQFDGKLASIIFTVPTSTSNVSTPAKTFELKLFLR